MSIGIGSSWNDPPDDAWEQAKSRRYKDEEFYNNDFTLSKEEILRRILTMSEKDREWIKINVNKKRIKKNV